jgi:hypothetical protein
MLKQKFFGMLPLIAGLILVFSLAGCVKKDKTAAETAVTHETAETEDGINTAVTAQTQTGQQENKDIDITNYVRQEAIFLGLFGDKYQKMGIAFLTIKRINDTQYEVTGKSQLDKICDFRGTLEVEAMEGDSSYGNATGKYLFEEDRNQTETGIFEGTFKIQWLLGEDFRTGFGIVEKANSRFGVAASFTGNWKSYRTGAVFKAGWGNLREDFVPVAGWNPSDFWIQEEYRSSGWALEIDQYKYFMEDSSTAEERLKAHPDYRKWHEWWK